MSFSFAVNDATSSCKAKQCDGNFPFRMVGETVVLKEKHKYKMYHTQVQMQMGVTGIKKCLVVVFTNVSCPVVVVPVTFNQAEIAWFSQCICCSSPCKCHVSVVWTVVDYLSKFGCEVKCFYFDYVSKLFEIVIWKMVVVLFRPGCQGQHRKHGTCMYMIIIVFGSVYMNVILSLTTSFEVLVWINFSKLL